jgi:hypothetical protein
LPKISEIAAIKAEPTDIQIPALPSPKDHPMHPIPDRLIKSETREDPTKMDIIKDEPSYPPFPTKTETIARQSSSTPKPDVKVESRGRSHSPPKGPRAYQWRKSSKSPPKGPRNHGGSSTSSMVNTPVLPPAAPASMQMYPTGPRADRIRPPKEKEDVTILRSTVFSQIPPPANERWVADIEPLGPKGRYGIAHLELEVSLVLYTCLLRIH